MGNAGKIAALLLLAVLLLGRKANKGEKEIIVNEKIKRHPDALALAKFLNSEYGRRYVTVNGRKVDAWPFLAETAVQKALKDGISITKLLQRESKLTGVVWRSVDTGEFGPQSTEVDGKIAAKRWASTRQKEDGSSTDFAVAYLSGQLAPPVEFAEHKATSFFQVGGTDGKSDINFRLRNPELVEVFTLGDPPIWVFYRAEKAKVAKAKEKKNAQS